MVTGPASVGVHATCLSQELWAQVVQTMLAPPLPHGSPPARMPPEERKATLNPRAELALWVSMYSSPTSKTVGCTTTWFDPPAVSSLLPPLRLHWCIAVIVSTPCSYAGGMPMMGGGASPPGEHF